MCMFFLLPSIRFGVITGCAIAHFDNMHTKRGENHKCNMKIYIRTFCHSFDWLPSIDIEVAFDWTLSVKFHGDIFETLQLIEEGKKMWKNKQKNKINYLPIRYSFVDIVQNGRETFKIQWFKNHRRFFFFNYSNWSMKILFVFNFKVNKLSKLSVYKYKMNKCTDKLTIENIINIINV